MSILQVDCVFICKAQVLTKMVWTQPQKYSSQPLSPPGTHLRKEREGAAWWRHLPISLPSLRRAPPSELIAVLLLR